MNPINPAPSLACFQLISSQDNHIHVLCNHHLLSSYPSTDHQSKAIVGYDLLLLSEIKETKAAN